MIVGLGIDVVALDRFQETIEKTPGLVERVFTPSERTMGPASLAARWAAMPGRWRHRQLGCILIKRCWRS